MAWKYCNAISGYLDAMSRSSHVVAKSIVHCTVIFWFGKAGCTQALTTDAEDTTSYASDDRGIER
jgi:hypothetical protein